MEEKELFVKLFFYYIYGIGVERNIFHAVEYLEKTLQFNKPIYSTLYGIFLLQGDFVEKDEKAAFLLFQKSSKLHYYQSQFWLGICFIEGIGTSKSFYPGLELVRQSVEQFDHVGIFYLSIIDPLNHKYC